MGKNTPPSTARSQLNNMRRTMMNARIIAWLVLALWTLLGCHCGCRSRSQHPTQRSAPTPTNAVGSAMTDSKLLTQFVPIADPRISVMGRVDRADPKRVRIGFPGVTLRIALSGSELGLRGACTSAECQLIVIVDGAASRPLRLPQGTADTLLVKGLAPGVHHVDIVRRTEHWQGIWTVEGVLLGAHGELTEPKPWPERKLQFIGDSVTSGEGADRQASGGGTGQAATADAYGSYGMILARALNAQCHLISYGGRGLIRNYEGKRNVVNAPQFFELALPDESRHSPWDHRAYVPDLVFISLGTNDFNFGIGPFPTAEDFAGAYVAFLKRIRSLYPNAKVLVTEGSIVNDGTRDPKRVLQAYLDETVRRLNDPDIQAVRSKHYPGDGKDAHPTGEEHVQMARDFEPVIRTMVGW